MRSSASHFLPILLLLSGCGGMGMDSAGDDPQLPAPPTAVARADDRPEFSASPGATYVPPAADGRASDLTDQANSYRTADGVVHTLPRGRRATPAPERPSAPERVSARPSTPEPLLADGPPPSDGPQGTSGRGADADRYDAVGYAGVRGVASNNPATANAIVAVHSTLPAGTILELTSLDAGRTILVLVTATMPVPPDRLLDISPAAAKLLGGEANGTLAVRVRRVIATPQDQNLLRSGQAASDRIDAPPALVAALRRRLGTPSAAAPPPPARSAPPARAISAPGASYPVPGRAVAPRPQAPVVAARGGIYVQVAALSAPDRAQALAHSLGGTVRPAGRLYKVQLGPYASAAEADHAKAQLAARGYGGAVIARVP